MMEDFLLIKCVQTRSVESRLSVTGSVTLKLVGKVKWSDLWSALRFLTITRTLFSTLLL